MVLQSNDYGVTVLLQWYFVDVDGDFSSELIQRVVEAVLQNLNTSGLLKLGLRACI
jgi:hypothetical protein